MKRGPKAGKYGLTLKEIAAAENCSVATVERTLNSAVSKLQQIPGSFTVILSLIHAVDFTQRDLLQPGSVECRKDWINHYASL
jgi:hypothetical protein